MKKHLFIVALATISTITTTTSCDSSTKKVEDANDKVVTASQDLKTATEDFNKEYNQFKLESEARISKNDQDIADLKARTKELKKEAKADYEQKIDALEKKNRSMKEKVTVYKEDNKEGWESFKQEFGHDMDALGSSLRDLTTNNAK